MRKEVIENAGLTAFAEIGLIIFVAVFLLIFLRAVFMKKDSVEHMGNLPLEDGMVVDSDVMEHPQEVTQ